MRKEASLGLMIWMVLGSGLSCSQDTKFLAKGHARNLNQAGAAGEDAVGDPLDRSGSTADESGAVIPGADTADLGALQEQAGIMREEFLGKQVKTFKPVDVVFVMDTSGSMDDEKVKLQESMTTFVNTFVTQSKNVDFQVFMVGDGFMFPMIANETRLARVDQAVGSWNALTILRDFIGGGYQNAIFTADGGATQLSTRRLRANARTEVVIVTDDNAKRKTTGMAINTTEFLAAVPAVAAGLGADLHINGIVGLKAGQDANNPDCNIAAIGSEYVTLAQTPRVMGKIYDLCVQDWNGLLKQISDSIVQNVSQAAFALKSKPLDPSKIRIELVEDGTELKDFTYDAVANEVVFTAAAAPKPDMKFRIIYIKQ